MSEKVLETGGPAGVQVMESMDALNHFDDQVAFQVLQREQVATALGVEIDHHLATLIARRSPTQRELRLVVGISKTAGH